MRFVNLNGFGYMQQPWLALLTVFWLLIVVQGDTTSRYHRYRIDHACDVASSTFVPYTGIRIQQARYTRIFNGQTEEYERRRMRASLCLHGSRYTQAYASYTPNTPATDWIDWAAKFCFNDATIPEPYQGCFVMAKTFEENGLPQALHLLSANRQAGVLYKCLERNCSNTVPYSTLLTDEAYMAWDRPREWVNETALRIPLMYTAELFSQQHFRAAEVPILCTAEINKSEFIFKGLENWNTAVKQVVMLADKLMGVVPQDSGLDDFDLEALNQRLITVFTQKNKLAARLVTEKLAKLATSFLKHT